MDIGYFLKLMTDKNASDMFMTTGAPVYIKVEGKALPARQHQPAGRHGEEDRLFADGRRPEGRRSNATWS